MRLAERKKRVIWFKRIIVWMLASSMAFVRPLPAAASDPSSAAEAETEFPGSAEAAGEDAFLTDVSGVADGELPEAEVPGEADIPDETDASYERPTGKETN